MRYYKYYYINILWFYAVCCETVIDEQFGLPEGAPCIAHDGKNGTCLNINRCLEVAKILPKKINPKICSFEGKIPNVCCTDCDKNLNISNYIFGRYGGYYLKSGQKAYDNCLQYLVNLDYPCPIYGFLSRRWNPERGCYEFGDFPEDYTVAAGIDAGRDEYPHMTEYDILHRQINGECLQYIVSLDYPCPRYGFLSRRWSPAKRCHELGNFPEIYTTTGGQNANRGEYPHMALLGYGSDLEAAQWLCGGSVITEKFILTAGHCISSPELGPVKYVALGILKRTDSSEFWQRYKVRKVIPHPEYKAPSKYHDIALLETENRIQFSSSVLPACLNTGEASDESAWATGWGALGHRKQLADNLQTVELRRYSKKECSVHFPPHRHLLQGYDHAKQMCYGDKEKDTCEGDSGGPLQVTSELVPCAYVILGVTSYGISCGFTGGSGMYTRVSHYIPWIESVVWPEY